MDLNLIIYENGSFLNEKTIFKLVECCYNLGYKIVALNVQFSGDNLQKLPIPPKLKITDNHLSTIKIYSRLTMKVEDVNCLYHLMRHENLKHYDLLAIEPLNEKMLNYLNGGHFDFDILTFSTIESNLVNIIKKANFSLPISKKIGIEINYANCLSGSSQRRQTLAFGQMLVDKTNGKNIILSSGANGPFHIRSPCDVVYIGLLFGLEEGQSKKSIYTNTQDVVKHSELRKNIVTSIIEIVDDNGGDQSILDELKNANNDKIRKRTADDQDGQQSIQQEQSKKIKLTDQAK